MAQRNYEIISGLDKSFLLIESRETPFHAAGLLIFDARPLARPDGGIDFQTIRCAIEATLHVLPPYRQKIRWTPDRREVAWVDDSEFDLDYHIRHTSLPRPGSDAQLKRMAAWIVEQPLDPARPLWETWVIEGLEGDRFALITKAHHCIVDGVGGLNLAEQLFSLEPRREPGEPRPFRPRPAPSADELSRDLRWRRLDMPLKAVRGLAEFIRNNDDPVGEIARSLRSLASMTSWMLRPASETPFNGSVGGHRIIDWTTMALDDMKAVRKALGCTINDLVLATLTGALREYLAERRIRPDGLDFRVGVAVDMRREGEGQQLGNRVGAWILQLPLGEPDPLRQLEEIRENTEQLKRSGQGGELEMLTPLLDLVPFDLSRFAVMPQRVVNLAVTNIPGPPRPLYLLDSEILEMIPLPPSTAAGMGLLIALQSYKGRMCWALQADRELVPDVASLCTELQTAFERLAEASAALVPEPERRDLLTAASARP